MKPTPETQPKSAIQPNGVHSFQKLSNDRQRAEIAKGIADFELRLAATEDLIDKLGRLTSPA